MADYNSIHTGPEIDEAIGAVRNKETTWDEKQDKLTGTPGQMVGFDSQGNAVAQSPASSGVTSFEGRTGAVTAQQGDYTAAMVGAVPTSRTVNGKALSADVEIGAGDVSYDNSETSAIITGDNVQSAIDQLFTSVSNGKTLIASAITDKGVSTSASDTFQQMATNIGQISSNTLLEEISPDTFCSAIEHGIPAYLFVSNYGILPIVGFPDGIDYTVNAGSNGNFGFTINTSSTEFVEVLFEGDRIQFYPYSREVFYGDNIFSEGNIKFFVDALVI